MREKIVNGFISAAAGAAAAAAVLWFAQNPADTGSKGADCSAVSGGIHEKVEELEVARLKVTDGIMVYHSETGEPLIELKDGVVLAKKEMLSRFIGGMEIVGQKLQMTSGDPSASDPPIFCELGAGEGGEGAYIALLSPKGTHSLNIGFDKNETGFVVSRNNDDQSMTAQAVLPIPQKNHAPAAQTVSPEEELETPAEEPVSAAESELPDTAPQPVVKKGKERKPERLALNNPQGLQQNRGGLPMLSPPNLK